MAKFGGNPEFREIMMEFSKLMANHFDNLATKQEEEDPIKKVIDNDPEVKAILEDKKV